jgi:hypothetical protein
LGLASLLHATCDALRKVIPHDAASICLSDTETANCDYIASTCDTLVTLKRRIISLQEPARSGLHFEPVLIRKRSHEFPAPQIKHAYNDGLRSGCDPLVVHDRAGNTRHREPAKRVHRKRRELLIQVAGQSRLPSKTLSPIARFPNSKRSLLRRNSI